MSSHSQFISVGLLGALALGVAIIMISAAVTPTSETITEVVPPTQSIADQTSDEAADSMEDQLDEDIEVAVEADGDEEFEVDADLADDEN